MARRSSVSGQSTSRQTPVGPLWKGPESDGITQSMISKWLVCRERARIAFIEGLAAPDKFNKAIEYGQMWHTCEEANADGGLDWNQQLIAYCRSLIQRYPRDKDEIDHWYQVCKTQFPIYLEHYEPVPGLTPLLQEQTFNVPYKLPSGRTVKLRGKWDAVDLTRTGPCKNCKDEVAKKGGTPNNPAWIACGHSSQGIWLGEHKTKGEVDEEAIVRQMRWDLQTMMYLVALCACRERFDATPHLSAEFNNPLLGVRYNVVRRPLSGGKGSIVRHKARGNKPEESRESFYNRLSGIIKELPDTFFLRLEVKVSDEEIQTFRRKCLDPILENICIWYDWVTNNLWNDPFMGTRRPERRSLDEVCQNWVHPYGIRNNVNEGYEDAYDNYIQTGSTTGLRRVTQMFTELV